MRQQQGKTSPLFLIVFIILFWGWFLIYGPVPQFKQHFLNSWNTLIVQFPWLQPAHWHTTPVDDHLPQVVNEIETERCDATMPKHGKVFVWHGVDGKMPATVHLVNTLAYMSLVHLDNEAQGASYDVFLYPKQSTLVQLPAGQYAISVEVGSTWCNVQQGFEDGSQIDGLTTLSLRNEKSAYVKVSSYGTQMQDVMISVQQSMAGATSVGADYVEGRGEMVLYRGEFGHYHLEGTINQQPAQFMVDTGASFVAISESFARSAGITECERSKAQTANGVVDVCLARAKEVIIGPFKLNNILVSYSPAMDKSTFLLGMNVISQFQVEQQGDVMRLKR